MVNTLLVPVFIFRTAITKSHKPSGVNNRNDWLTALEVARCWRGWLLLRAAREESAVPDLPPRLIHGCLHPVFPCIIYSLHISVSKCPLLMRTLVLLN